MTTEFKVGQRITSIDGYYGTIDLVGPDPEITDDDAVIYVHWDGLNYTVGLGAQDVISHKIVVTQQTL